MTVKIKVCTARERFNSMLTKALFYFYHVFSFLNYLKIFISASFTSMDLSTAGSQTQMQSYVRGKMQTIKWLYYFKYQAKVKLLVSLREIEHIFSVITGTLKAYSISGTLII